VFVEVNTGSLESANYIKNNMGRFLETEVFPKLEQTLDDFNQTGRVARIESLNLNLATLRDDYFSRDDFFKMLESEIVKQFAEKIESEFGFPGIKNKETIVNGKVEIFPTEKNREEVFFFFMKNGYLPWFAAEEDVHDFLTLSNWKKYLENNEFFTRLTNLLKSENTISERFVFQLNEKLILAFLQKINSSVKTSEAQILNLSERLPPEVRHYFLKLLLVHSIFVEKPKHLQAAFDFKNSVEKLIPKKNKEFEKKLHAGISSIFEGADWVPADTRKQLAEIILTPFQQKNSKKTKVKEAEVLDDLPQKDEADQDSFFGKQEGEIAVQNAGLVLIHPFLKTFFKAVDLLNDKGKIKKTERQTAVQTLHFLATGNEEFFEGNLVLEKFLCGFPLKMPVEKQSLLSENIKSESQQLLTEVIRHWPALKNTSPDGLRQMFFHRKGKLYRKENNYKLIVERKAQDILLDKLAWNISLVKLPWSKELLYIEW
jgi:hypothetical protein